MKIERIQTYLVERFLLVRVYTDEGIVGTGEAGLWAHQRMVAEAIKDLSEYFVGKDPTRIEHNNQVVTRDTHFQGAVLSAALSAIDIACWDILGKSVGKPVYQLLGGKVRDKVRVFGVVGGRTVQEFVERAEQQVEAGYHSLRAQPFLPGWEQRSSTQTVREAVEITRAIREAIGPDVDLGLEIHRNLSTGDAVMLGKEVEPFRLMYYEDPLAPQSTEALKYVAAHVHIPIAAGERSYSLNQFKEILDTGAVAYIRPDYSLAGGITQGKKIAALAEAAFVGVFPHLMGSPFNLAAYVQLNAAIPNYVLMENHAGSDRFNDMVDRPLERDGGYVVVPDRPGIGLELSDAALAKYAYRAKEINGYFREDGSVAH